MVLKEKQKYEQHCAKCGYDWQSRNKEPKACPSCKRYHWKEAKKC